MMEAALKRVTKNWAMPTTESVATQAAMPAPRRWKAK